MNNENHFITTTTEGVAALRAVYSYDLEGRCIVNKDTGRRYPATTTMHVTVPGYNPRIPLPARQVAWVLHHNTTLGEQRQQLLSIDTSDQTLNVDNYTFDASKINPRTRAAKGDAAHPLIGLNAMLKVAKKYNHNGILKRYVTALEHDIETRTALIVESTAPAVEKLTLTPPEDYTPPKDSYRGKKKDEDNDK